MTQAVASSVQSYPVSPGVAYPLGVTVYPEGVNFSLFSEGATGIELLLFNEHDDPEPFQIIRLDPTLHKTFHLWHVFLEGLQPGMHYAYRVDGPYNPGEGHRFDRNKVLIDLYSKGNNKALWKRGKACIPGDNLDSSIRCVVIDVEDYDWEGDCPINRPMNETIIYEMHVRGFTQSPTSRVRHSGTFAGVIEKIPYLQELGITAVELLPIFEFDDVEVLRTAAGQPLHNYWGYSTMSYFAPHPSYCVNPQAGTHVREFRDMVKALHRAGIEVILDVVFNHTDEGNHQGPVFCFKGFDNCIYYHLVSSDKQYY